MREDGTEPTFAEEPERVVLTATGQRFTVRELRDRVSIVEPRILLLREIDAGTRETLDTIGTAIEDLARNLPAWGLVVDLTDTDGSTTSDYRSYIPEFFAALHQRSNGRLKMVAIAFVGNPVARIVTKFVMARFTRVAVSIEKNRARALEAVRRALQGV